MYGSLCTGRSYFSGIEPPARSAANEGQVKAKIQLISKSLIHALFLTHISICMKRTAKKMKLNGPESVKLERRILARSPRDTYPRDIYIGIALIAKFCVNIAFFECHMHFRHIVVSPYAK